MCGICGGIGAPRTAVERMTDRLYHRGPDQGAVFTEGRVALGIRRLAIIDLESGRQPIESEDGRVVVVFNGEIYNFRDLRSELEAAGHRFRTRTDTEVLVHGWEAWGRGLVGRLRGMFAFAVYDRRGDRPRLFLARDRLGIKPLYYHRSADRFLFSSEVRSLVAAGIEPRVSAAGLHAYLAFGSVQEPLTLLEGVQSLPPGHWMEVDPESADTVVERYWDFPAPTGGGGPDVADEAAELLEEAVRLRLIADVPLGAFLSGGIDSGGIVSLMARGGSERVRTFTIRFEESEYDEGPLARRTAERVGSEHAEIMVTAADLLDSLPAALAAMDQPSLDGVNTYQVAGAARRAGLTVALSGVGGDELFGGYPTFRTVPWLDRLRPLQRGTAPFAALLGPVLGAVPGSPDARRKLRAYLAGEAPFGHPYFLARAVLNEREVADALAAGAAAEAAVPGAWAARVEETLRRSGEYDAVGAVSYLECSHYMLSTLLRDTDQMSMAHSLEVRVPLLDHRLVEFAFRVPGRERLAHRVNGKRRPTPKPLLVAALRGALPDEVVYRKKSTFTFPWERWLRGPLRETVERTLARPPEALGGLLNGDAGSRVWRAYLAGATSWSRPWMLYVLFRWVDEVLQPRSAR